jgi:DNA-binding response OmpR family regulator
MNLSTSSKKEKILVIESNAKLGKSITEALKDEGYIVTLVADGNEGLKAIYDILPHLIIIDLILPDADAYEIIQKKHSEVMLSKIPIFVLSTQGEPIDMHLIPENSVTDFILTLDPNPTELVKRVNKQFGHQSSTESQGTSTTNSSGKKVLWVEDDKLIGSILEKKFISSGFDLFHAHNGEEAMNHLKDHVPDIIILDLMLPGMDGFEILQKVRMDQKLKSVPAMILSNLSKPSDLEKAKILGASKFLVKASSSLDKIVDEVKAIVLH